MEPLISIIIPTYNRGDLLGETLDSIVAQSYSTWECIVIDDDSTDDTIEVVNTYSDEERIKFFRRPKNLKKGANTCRNFGLEKSRGDFVIWFDSDDLMKRNHVECKLEEIKKREVDFVVAKTVNFEDGKLYEPYKYIIKDYGIKAEDFILSKIHWYTYDVMLTREVANKISWNEAMTSWQDHNYFCKMLLITENGFHIDKILTERRLHQDSIQAHLTKSDASFSHGMLNYRILNFEDLQDKVDLHIKIEMIYDMMNHSFRLASLKKESEKNSLVKILVLEYLGKKSLYYFKLSLFLTSTFKKGHFFLENAKRRNKLKRQEVFVY